MVKKYQNMNKFGVTTCGIIIDDKNKTYTYYPRQNMPTCCGKKVSVNKINELLLSVINKGYKPLKAY